MWNEQMNNMAEQEIFAITTLSILSNLFFKVPSQILPHCSSNCTTYNMKQELTKQLNFFAEGSRLAVKFHFNIELVGTDTGY